MRKDYIKLSDWKEEVLTHQISAIDEVHRLLIRYKEEDGLKQILHELFEMGGHLEWGGYYA